MTNNIEFILRLRDLMSTRMQAATVTNRNELNTVSVAAKHTGDVINSHLNESLGAVAGKDPAYGDYYKNDRGRYAQTNIRFLKNSVQKSGVQGQR